MKANTEIVITLKSREINTPKDIKDIIDYLRGRIDKALETFSPTGESDKDCYSLTGVFPSKQGHLEITVGDSFQFLVRVESLRIAFIKDKNHSQGKSRRGSKKILNYFIQ